MEECLAIKPDLVFLWDEAWFGFARFGPTYRQRTAMHAASVLRERLKSDSYRQRYAAYSAEVADLDADDDEALLSRRLLADPDQARVRVYATQIDPQDVDGAAPGIDDPYPRPGLQNPRSRRLSMKPT